MGQEGRPSQRRIAMLVLTRRTEQGIVIGEDIRIVVTSIAGNRVCLGITAPDSIRVLRAELQEGPRQDTVTSSTPDYQL
jgi:carbon storage regulator